MDFWTTPLGWTLATAGGILLVTVGILISLAFLLLADRKIWAGVQMRKGPNVVGPFGLLQSFADFFKFVLKEIIVPAGADKVVFPSKMQGARLGQELMRPNLLERLRLDDRNSIEEIKVPQAFIGRSLRDLNLRKSYRVNVLAAGPANQLMVNPPASHVLREGEVLVVMGSAEALEALPSR